MVGHQSISMQQQLLGAREAERKHIARELHDQIIQSLIGLNYQLADLRTRPDANLDTRINQLQGDLRQVLDDVRRICGNLRPSAPDGVGLAEMTQAHLADLQQHSSFHISLQIEGDPAQRLYADVALCIYRVLQETLCNVQKHAAACSVNVRLLICPDEVVLTITDDGVGFAVSPQPLTCGQHFGLLGMRERLALVQGTLEITSGVGQGTQILAWVPCRSVLPHANDEVS